MQSDFSNLNLSALFDLLASYTQKYTLMLRDWGPAPEFKECEELILKLQTEIESRKLTKDEDGDSEDNIIKNAHSPLRYP
jgi:hypothetical protein